MASPEALTVFAYNDLFEKRRVTYRRWSLQIDDQATEIMIATRDFVVAAWNELNAHAAREERLS